MKTVLKMLAICMMAGGLGVQSVYAEPLVIQEQGSFSAGGTIITAPGTFDAKKPLDSAGQTYHGDHASVFYQIPENPHKYPIVMLHGAGQSSRTWESTPDGREGFQNIFLRRGFSTYIVDQPRRGDAGRTTVEGTVTPKPDEQMWFNQFRVGVWPDYFKGVQFSHDKEALNQYFRQMTPNTGPFDVNVISDAMSAVVDKSGPAILFTHSQGGGPGWYTAMKNNKVKAIVAFEPGSGFVFPEKELPAPMPSAFDTLKGEPVPMEQFMALTKIPIKLNDCDTNISGRVLDYGCTVSSDSLNFTVDLQKNSARQFPTTGSTSPVVPFQITLSECSKGTTGVRVAFNGIEDAENNTLLKLDEGSNTASGLGIEILDGNMRPVKLNDLHAGMQWIPLVPDQNNILPYSARLKSTQKSVNPGLVSASATFTLEFQ